jgi:hypothetical protein
VFSHLEFATLYSFSFQRGVDEKLLLQPFLQVARLFLILLCYHLLWHQVFCSPWLLIYHCFSLCFARKIATRNVSIAVFLYFLFPSLIVASQYKLLGKGNLYIEFRPVEWSFRHSSSDLAIFGDAAVWTLDCVLARQAFYHLSHSPISILLELFFGYSLVFLPGLALDCDPSTYSCVASFTGTHHYGWLTA